MAIHTVTFDPLPMQGMIDNFSKTITYIPVTKTINSVTGDETLTEGTSTTIYGMIFQSKNVYARYKAGLVQGGDAIFMGKTADMVTKNDILSFGGFRYRVDNVTNRYLDQTFMYCEADLFVVDGQ
jgi:hypothetical protein